MVNQDTENHFYKIKYGSLTLDDLRTGFHVWKSEPICETLTHSYISRLSYLWGWSEIYRGVTDIRCFPAKWIHWYSTYFQVTTCKHVGRDPDYDCPLWGHAWNWHQVLDLLTRWSPSSINCENNFEVNVIHFARTRYKRLIISVNKKHYLQSYNST